MSRKATVGIDYTSRDYESFRDLMIDNIRRELPEYDTSQTDAGIVIIEGMAKGLDILSLYNDIVANDVILETTQDRGIAVILSKMLGHTPHNATASKVKQLFVLSKELDQDKIISAGTVIYTPESSDSMSIYFETTEDLVIPAGCLGDEKDSDGNYLYLADSIQGRAIKEDILGTSDGVTGFQSFRCGYQKVIVDSLEVYVNEGNGYELWERVDNFIDSNSSSRHYTATIDEFDRCSITFGNGALGKVPSSYESGIIADYKIGGGEIGNVIPNSITEVQSGISFLDYTTNPFEPYELGTEKESLEEIKELAPKAFRTQNRAVAEGDFADLIRLGFNKYIRFTRDITTIGSLVIDVYYAMREGYTMTDELRNEIQSYMSNKKVVGSTINLLEYEKKVVNINATLKIFKDYDREVTTGLVNQIITSYFQLGEFDFGEELILSDLENEIVDGLDGVRSFRINTPNDDVTPENNEIITLGTVTIEVNGGI